MDIWYGIWVYTCEMIWIILEVSSKKEVEHLHHGSPQLVGGLVQPVKKVDWRTTY